MIYRVFFILCFILASCKKGEENKPYNITINGVVTDQVTGQPVAGATVSLGIQRVHWPTDGLGAPKQSTSTGPNGRYELITSTEHYIQELVSIGDHQSLCIALIASKPEYVGSNRWEIPYYDAQNSVLDFQLYHSSELNLHIMNDTANSIDSVDIKLIKILYYHYYFNYDDSRTVLTQVCNKRKQDSTYVIKNIFGNWEYSIQVLKPGSYTPITKYTLTPKPDTINSFDISY
jgi:hypothetical protein